MLSTDILSRCSLFARLAQDDLEALAAIATRRHFEAGESLFLAFAKPEGLHIVVSGSVKVFVISPESGREIILTVEYPYNTVAELPTFDGGNYPANAEALGPTETLFLEQTAFDRVLSERYTITAHLLRGLGRRLRRLVSLIEQLSFQEVVHRLAGYLLEQAAAGLPFQLETNTQIAAIIGTVPELVSRNLSRLYHSGVVKLEGRNVVQIDERALSGLAKRAGR